MEGLLNRRHQWSVPPWGPDQTKSNEDGSAVFPLPSQIDRTRREGLKRRNVPSSHHCP